MNNLIDVRFSKPNMTIGLSNVIILLKPDFLISTVRAGTKRS